MAFRAGDKTASRIQADLAARRMRRTTWEVGIPSGVNSGSRGVKVIEYVSFTSGGVRHIQDFDALLQMSLERAVRGILYSDLGGQAVLLRAYHSLSCEFVSLRRDNLEKGLASDSEPAAEFDSSNCNMRRCRGCHVDLLFRIRNSS